MIAKQHLKNVSIQELWLRKLSGRGGLGYHYPIGGYGITGRGGSEDSSSVWSGLISRPESINSWIPESTVEGFNPYPIGLENGKDIYKEYTPDEINQFIIDRDLKRVEPDTYKMIKKNPKKFNELLEKHYEKSKFMPVITENIDSNIEALKDQLRDVGNIETTQEEDREILETESPDFYKKITTDIYKIGKHDTTYLNAYENDLFPNCPKPELLAIGHELRYNILLGKIRDNMRDYYNFINEAITNDPKLYDIDIGIFNLEDFLKVYKTSLESEYTEIIKNRYYNELYYEANKRGKGLDTERGNIMENILDEKQGFFKSIVNGENNVNNTKDYKSLYYTKEYIDEVKRRASEYFEIADQIKKLKLLNSDDDKIFNEIDELNDILNTKKQPDTTYYVVDYVGEYGLYELKCLKFSFIDYKYMIYDKSNPSHKIIEKYSGVDKKDIPIKESIKRHENGINFVATKIDGYTGMDIIFNRDNNNNVYIEQIKYHGINTLKTPRYNYNGIFALKDGFYTYDILKDPNLYIKHDGRAVLLNTPRVADVTGKFDYIIPVDRLKLMIKQNINGPPITLKSANKIIKGFENVFSDIEGLKHMPNVSKPKEIIDTPVKKRGRPIYTEAQRRAREEAQVQYDKALKEEYKNDKDFEEAQYGYYDLKPPKGGVTMKTTKKFIKGLAKAKKKQEDIDKEFEESQLKQLGIVSKPKKGRPKKK